MSLLFLFLFFLFRKKGIDNCLLKRRVSVNSVNFTIKRIGGNRENRFYKQPYIYRFFHYFADLARCGSIYLYYDYVAFGETSPNYGRYIFSIPRLLPAQAPKRGEKKQIAYLPRSRVKMHRICGAVYAKNSRHV